MFSEDIKIRCVHIQVRKDIVVSGYGGEAVYIKDVLYNKRRLDFEVNGLEYIWCKLKPSHSTNIFGFLFLIENSVSFALDTGILLLATSTLINQILHGT